MHLILGEFWLETEFLTPDLWGSSWRQLEFLAEDTDPERQLCGPDSQPASSLVHLCVAWRKQGSVRALGPAPLNSAGTHLGGWPAPCTWGAVLTAALPPPQGAAA